MKKILKLLFKIFIGIFVSFIVIVLTFVSVRVYKQKQYLKDTDIKIKQQQVYVTEYENNLNDILNTITDESFDVKISEIKTLKKENDKTGKKLKKIKNDYIAFKINKIKAETELKQIDETIQRLDNIINHIYNKQNELSQKILLKDLEKSISRNIEPQDIYRQDSKQKEYNLTDTIKILYALKNFEKNADNFDEYLEQLSLQDYSKVQPDVIKLQEQSLPILKELIELRYKNNSRFNPLNYLRTFSKLWEVIDFEASDSNIRIVNGLPIISFDGDMKINTSKIKEVANEVLDEFEGNNKELEAINNEYIEYLKKSSQIYKKYFKEYDEYLLYKDKALLDVYNNNINSATEALNKVLKIEPSDKEALLLQAFCILRNTMPKVISKDLKRTDSNIKLLNRNDNETNIKQNMQNTKYALIYIDKYIELYPESSAPALLLKGLYFYLIGNKKDAFSNYDEASIRYPMQADELLDKFNLYNQREELKKTHAGTSVLKLYQATMLGSGGFSPEVQKAFIYINDGEYKKANEEIYNHFYRRANQEVYDYMLEDINFCENYFNDNENFNKIFNIADVELFYKKESTLGMFKKIKIGIRSNKKLQNIRGFLCLHLTGSYKNEYKIINMGKLNFVDADSTKFFKETLDKKIDEIVSAKAILLTDDGILVTPEINMK